MTKRLGVVLILAVLSLVGVLYAQSVVTSRGLVVRASPAVESVVVQATKNAVVGDTFRVFAVANDGQGNEIVGRKFEFRITNMAGQPDTSLFVIRSANDTSALIFVKAPGDARVIAVTISP